ncbi:hypothetical protein PENSPDRAFT_685358 [Peniophora sp. CONT]|nr:hypothetical protein PENSPDRAFT_685358 [Peniophora sp. CONT]
MASKKRSTQKARLDDEEAWTIRLYNPEANVIEEHIKRVLNEYLLAQTAFFRLLKGRALPSYEENGQIYGYAHLMEVSPETIPRLRQLLPLASRHKDQGNDVHITTTWFSVHIWRGAFTDEDRADWMKHAKWVEGEFKQRYPDYKYNPQSKNRKVAKKPKVIAQPKQRFTIPDSHYGVPQAPIALGSCIAGPSNPTPSRRRTVKRRRGGDDDEIAPTRQPAKRPRVSVMQSPALHHLQPPVAPLPSFPWSPSSSSSSYPPFTPARAFIPMDGSPAFWRQGSSMPAPSTSAYQPSLSTQQCNNLNGADVYPTPQVQGGPHMHNYFGSPSPHSANTNAAAYRRSILEQSVLPESFRPNNYVTQPDEDVRAQRESFLNSLGSSSSTLRLPRLYDCDALAVACSDEYGTSRAFDTGADSFNAQNHHNVVDVSRTAAPSPLGNILDQEAMRVPYGSELYGYDDWSGFPTSTVVPSYSYASHLQYGSSQAGGGYAGHEIDYPYTYDTSVTDTTRGRPSPSARRSANVSHTSASHDSITPAVALASTASNATGSADTSVSNTFQMCGIP